MEIVHCVIQLIVSDNYFNTIHVYIYIYIYIKHFKYLYHVSRCLSVMLAFVVDMVIWDLQVMFISQILKWTKVLCISNNHTRFLNFVFTMHTILVCGSNGFPYCVIRLTSSLSLKGFLANIISLWLWLHGFKFQPLIKSIIYAETFNYAVLFNLDV